MHKLLADASEWDMQSNKSYYSDFNEDLLKDTPSQKKAAVKDYMPDISSYQKSFKQPVMLESPAYVAP
jgi:hypothetical protein